MHNRVADILEKSIVVLYTLLLMIVISICLFSTNMDYFGKYISKQYVSSFILIPIGLLFMLSLYWGIKNIFLSKKVLVKNLYLIITIIVFVVQCILVKSYYFYTDWDVHYVIQLSETLAHGFDTSESIFYFSRYPNNLFLAIIYSWIIKAVHILGLHEQEYYGMLVVLCMLNSLAGYILLNLLHKLFGKISVSLIGYFIFVSLVGLSPWVSIPYSDSISITFPVLVTYLFIMRKDVKRKKFLYFSISILSIWGFVIKPQTLIVFIAILIIELIEDIKYKIEIKNICNRFIMIGTGLLAGYFVYSMVVNSVDLGLYKDYKFGFQHILLMGMNPVSYGGYSDDDVNFSGSFNTVSERNKGDMQEVINRIDNMGVRGLLTLFERKILTCYNDGTFYWGGEGAFFYEIRPDDNSFVSKISRGLYYTKSCSDVGIYYRWWSNYVQMIWLTVLALSGTAFRTIIGDKKDTSMVLFMLSIIGLTIYELFAEARSRYLYIYVPLFIVIAMYGLTSFFRTEKKN